MDVYAAKTIEYLIAVGYLILFVPFWRALSTAGVPVAARAAKAPARRPFEWFTVGDGVSIHPGHAWAQPVGAQVAVGLDDFASKLLGPIKGFRLPALGAPIAQGERAWEVLADGKTVDMVSPVDGIVVALNEAALDDPARLAHDPYGTWVMKVEPTAWTRSARQLLTGDAARRLMDSATERLFAHMGGGPGLVLQDGGLPVAGIARELSPDGWDAIAREFFLTA